MAEKLTAAQRRKLENLEVRRKAEEKCRAENERRFKAIYDVVRGEEFQTLYESVMGHPWHKSFEDDPHSMQGRIFEMNLWMEHDAKHPKITELDKMDGPARRRAMFLLATPKWADRKKILEVYKERNRLNENSPGAFHVDHVIPIQGRLVCGLHVHNNLQVIDAKLNLSKSNAFDPELCEA